MTDQALVNRQWIFRDYVRPDEYPTAEHFELIESSVPALSDGQVLVRVLVLGTSPAQRMYVTKDSKFHITVEIGEVMSGRGVGVVVASKNDSFAVGDIVQGTLGWQDYVVVSPDPRVVDGRHVTSIQHVSEPVRPLTTVLGMFGQLAFSAYVGIIEIGDVRDGDTVLISAAAGGVGSMACQLARIRGASRIVGIAGGDDKCQWLLDEELCDAAINYKRDDFAEQLAAALPDGIDVYLDSVGGDTLDLALQHISDGARVVLCGHISTEYQNPRPPGPRHYYNLLYRRARMEGFFVFDYLTRWPEFESNLREWFRDGKLKLVDHVLDGLEYMPAALTSLFEGSNTGGCVVRVADDPTDLPVL